jgi:hypothetical protein
MVIIAIFSLIIGIIIIIGNSLFIFHSKKNDPGKEWDYWIVLYTYLFGIIFIICAITALTWFTIVLIILGAIALNYHEKYKKYEKKYPISPIRELRETYLFFVQLF